MAEPTSHTAHEDAPLSVPKKPDPRAARGAGASVDKDDELVGRTVSINRSRAQLYAFWHNFANLPLFMENIEGISG